MELKEIKAKEAMIKKNKLITANSRDKVAAVILRMIRENIGGIPIVEGDECVGIITMRDIMFANFYGAGELPISDIMTKDLITVSPEASLEKVINLMLKNKVERIPVTEEGELKGLVVRNSLLKTINNF